MTDIIKIESISTIVVIVAALVALWLNFKRDLMMLQLNSYRNERYARWFSTSGESTAVLRLVIIAVLFCMVGTLMPFVAASLIAVVVMMWIVIALARRKYKKPLVWTNRARRIFVTMWIVSQAIAVICYFLTMSLKYVAVYEVLLNWISPIILQVSNWMLQPVEKKINKGYYNDAVRILKQMPNLKIIGITGSYGKTSTKHYLNRILAEQFDVVMTPGSYNTTMGVIRTIREYLKPYNEVFIVEMGAKQSGDIKKICDLVHPTMGIVTAVGEQHLESFKSIENIQKTKFELIDALPSDGFAVVNDDFEYVANRPVDSVECVRYAVRNVGNADYVATEISLDSTGTTFTIEGQSRKLTLHTKLVGECNVSNLMAAVIIALKLGVDDNKIRYAVDKIEQVEHRLNMKRTAVGVTIIDDAFNSNPTGSKMALEVLGAMKGGKRIVVTPGMIELGDRQYELNRELGRNAASNADYVIVVGEYNRDAIVAGLKDEEYPKNKVYAASSFADAQSHLSTMLASGDIVLYENDLPDTFK